MMKTTFLAVAFAGLVATPTMAAPPQTASGAEVYSQDPGQAPDGTVYNYPSAAIYAQAPGYYVQTPGYYVAPAPSYFAPPVVRGGEFVGSDPDANVRESLSRDAERNKY